MKHSYPEFYRECLPSEKGHLYEMGYLALIPGEDLKGHRLATCIPGNLRTVGTYPYKNLQNIMHILGDLMDNTQLLLGM